MKKLILAAAATMFFSSSAFALFGITPNNDVDFGHPWDACTTKAAEFVALKTGQTPISAEVLGPADEGGQYHDIEVFVETAECPDGSYSVFLNQHCAWINRSIQWGTCPVDRRQKQAPEKGQYKEAPEQGQYKEAPEQGQYKDAPEVEQGQYKDAPEVEQGQTKGKVEVEKEQELVKGKY